MPANVPGHLRHALPIVCGLTVLGLGISQGAFAQTIPESVRERCDRIASFGGSASYSILQNCVDVELAAPTTSGPPAIGGTARFYLVTSEGGQATPYNTLSECLQARAKATQTAICINR